MVQSRQPPQSLDIAGRQVYRRYQFRTDRADPQKLDLGLCQLGCRQRLFLVGLITGQRSRDGVGLLIGFPCRTARGGISRGGARCGWTSIVQPPISRVDAVGRDLLFRGHQCAPALGAFIRIVIVALAAQDEVY